MSEEREAEGARWDGRPWAARAVRLVALAGPLVASILFVRLAAEVVPAPSHSFWAFAAWWAGLCIASSGVLWAVDRYARRLLPLAALLRLSLVFPDQTPSRFQLALEAGRLERLQDRIELAQSTTTGTVTPQEAAERLLLLTAALDRHDRLTRGHSERVRAYAVMIGTGLGLHDRDLDRLNWAALVHDVGKLAVAPAILNKPGRPDEEEWQQIRRHPLVGETMLGPLREWLGPWAAAVGHHHERWDGTGYPRGLRGDRIPLAGRIVALADVFDVITSARSYKSSSSTTEARKEIARCAGTHFDPRVVRAFLEVSLGRLRFLMGPLSWLAHAPLLARVPFAPVTGVATSAAAVVTAATLTGVVPPPTALASDRAGAPPAAHRAETVPAPVASARRETATRAAGTRTPDVGAPRRKTRAKARADAGATTPAIPTRPVRRPPGLASDSAAASATPAMDARPQPAPVPSPGTSKQPTGKAPEQSGAAQPAGSNPARQRAPAPGDAKQGGGTGAPKRGEGGSTAPSGTTTQTVPPPTANNAPSIALAGNIVVLEDSGTATHPGWATVTSIGAGDQGQTVGYTLAVDRPELFAAGPSLSATGTLTFIPAADASGTAVVTVLGVDDGGTANGGTDTSPPKTAEIVITAVNDAPTVAIPGDISFAEDAGAQTVVGWLTGAGPGPGESGQATAVDVAADNPSLFADGPRVTPTGDLVFTPAANANGTARLTVTVIDDGGTASGGVDTTAAYATLTIRPVNDAPTLELGPDRLEVLGTGVRTIPGFAIVSKGPADEAGQTLTFDVSTDRPDLFTTQPAIDSAGTLTYAPGIALGIATVTVTVTDSGGTADGGVASSGAGTFRITVVL